MSFVRYLFRNMSYAWLFVWAVQGGAREARLACLFSKKLICLPQFCDFFIVLSFIRSSQLFAQFLIFSIVFLVLVYIFFRFFCFFSILWSRSTNTSHQWRNYRLTGCVLICRFFFGQFLWKYARKLDLVVFVYFCLGKDYLTLLECHCMLKDFAHTAMQSAPDFDC